MEHSETPNETTLLEEKIEQATTLIQQVERQFVGAEGVQKICNKIKAEIKFLTSLRSKQPDEIRRSLDTSNLLHFNGIVQCALRHNNCTAFCKTFTIPNQGKGTKLEVDLVLNGGETWVKVISRSARGLAMDHVSTGDSSSRSAAGQARCFKSVAAYYPYFYKLPDILFEFLNGVPSSVAEAVMSYGVRVTGDIIPIDHLVVLPEDSDSDSSISSPSSSSSEPSELNEEFENSSFFQEASNVLNLDVTAVFALISSLTHENGANFLFTSPMLNDQAKYERKNPVLPKLLRIMEGKKLIICRTAYDSVQNILSTVAGPLEKKRAEELFKRVTIVEDKITKRTEALKMGDKINGRSKVIFGSGDYYKAVTLTANRHFVNAAIYQGLRFAVIIHDSRALSEQKEKTAKPL